MFKLTKDDIEIKIQSEPLEIISILKKNLEYVYQKDGNWKKSWPVCFPWTGKFINDNYFLNNKLYKMTSHGFFRKIDNWEVTKSTLTELILKFESNDEFINEYPFKFELQIEYKLFKNKFINSIQITNKDNIIMPYGFGWHPAFYCDKDSAVITFESEQELFFIPEDSFIQSNMETIKTKQFKVSQYDFSKSNCYFIKHNSTNSVNLRDKFNHNITIDTKNYSHIMIWKCDNDANYICIEPWMSHQDEWESKNFPLDKKPGVLFLNKNCFIKYDLCINFS